MITEDANSLVNRSIYYWDYYLLTHDLDYLVAAYQFMTDYRKLGGELYEETEKSMLAAIEGNK